jgi:large subunit ribosomal protein L18
MNEKQIALNKVRKTRAMRVRKKLRGTSLRPRMSVVKSNKHIQIQLIDDENGKTLASTSSISKEFRNTEFSKRNKSTAAELGKKIAEFAKELNIKEVIFDRGPFKYHGVLAEVANAARESGLQL